MTPPNRSGWWRGVRQAREHHTAVLFVTHEINPILPYVDRVLYLTDTGYRIGPVDNVMTSETLTAPFCSLARLCVSDSHLTTFVVVTVAVVVTLLVIGRPLLFSSVDDYVAESRGVPGLAGRCLQAPLPGKLG